MGEPTRWGPFDRLHLQSHSQVASAKPVKSATIPPNALFIFTGNEQPRSTLATWHERRLKFLRPASTLKAGSHYVCHRGDMSTPTPVDGRFYMLKWLWPSLFSRAFQQLWGQTRPFYGPVVWREAAPPSLRISRQQGDKGCSRDMFKTPSSPPTSRRSRSNSVHAGRWRERETPWPRLITSVKLEIPSA